MVTMVTRGILILKTRILSYLRTKAEFSNHLRLMFDSSELKFRKIFNSNEFSPMRGDGNKRNFNSNDSKSSLTIKDGNKRNYKIFRLE